MALKKRSFLLPLLHMNSIEVKLINRSENPLPEYATVLSAGMDVRAHLSEDLILQPLERKLIPTGLILEIPQGYECQVRPRSGLALKKGLTVLNSPGTIDADYRGEVGVILINLSNEPVTIEPSERIAQLIFSPVIQVFLNETKELTQTDRGLGGFGSTGMD
jgi:dUTP pyrophosphatase